MKRKWPKSMVLDRDSFVSPTHGDREGTACNGHFGCTSPDIHGFLEAEGFRYAIRLPTNKVLQVSIAHLLKRPGGRPPNDVCRYHANFSCQAASRTKRRCVVIRVEWHAGKPYPCVGFIVTNLWRPAERVVAFCHHRTTAGRDIKEGKNAIKWSSLSCRNNKVRLQLHAMAAMSLSRWLRWPCRGRSSPRSCG